MLVTWVLLAANVGPAAAAVPTGEITPATALEAPHSLRSGLIVGFAFGGGLGGASGYPNDINRIGDPNAYSASGWMLGSTESLFVMGALTDYLNVGFFFSEALFGNRNWHSHGSSGGLRIEAFPLALAYPSLAGLGILAQFGIGDANLTSRIPGLPEANGTQSFAAAGVFYEWPFWHVLGGHFAAGPSLDFDATWSQPFERHGLFVSGRLAFCGGP